MADLQPCPLKTDPTTCPPDGHWQFNTNVVFKYSVYVISGSHWFSTYVLLCKKFGSLLHLDVWSDLDGSNAKTCGSIGLALL